MKVKNKFNIICIILLILSMLFPLTTNAFEQTGIFNKFPITDIIPFVYENQEVTSTLNSLVDKTEILKENYSLEESLKVISDLKEIQKKITENDHKNNYNIKFDKNNYEAGGFYKYKYGHTEWILRNIIYLVITNSPTSEDEITSMIDDIYEIGLIEMQNKNPDDKALTVLNNLLYIKDSFPNSYQEYLEYIIDISGDDASNYENGITPEYKIPSEYKTEYDRIKEENKLGNGYNKDDEGEFVKPTDKEDETYNPNFNLDNPLDGTIVLEPGNEPPTNVNNNSSIEDYFNKLNNITNNSHVNVKTYEIKNIYYTLDKTSENIEWINSGVQLSEENEITYNKLINLLNSISNHIDNSYVIEDSDMTMFITEGKNIVLNKVELVDEEELNILFDEFEKIGIKVMLKSDEVLDTSNSLTTKVEKGEINSISIDGTTLILTNKPILTKNIVQLPVKQVAEQLGYNVTINGKTITLIYEEITKIEKPIIEIPSDDNVDENESNVDNTKPQVEYEEVVVKTEIILTVGSNNYTINGQKNSFKTNVTSKNNVIYCEFDRIASLLDYDYSYNSEKNTLEFNK